MGKGGKGGRGCIGYMLHSPLWGLLRGRKGGEKGAKRADLRLEWKRKMIIISFTISLAMNANRILAVKLRN